jgi:hypothetical protein
MRTTVDTRKWELAESMNAHKAGAVGIHPKKDLPNAGFVRQNGAREDCTFCLLKDGIFFPSFLSKDPDTRK